MVFIYNQRWLTLIVFCTGVCVAAGMNSFWCNFQRTVEEEDLEEGDLILSTEVAGGQPEFYVPEEFYQITISSSVDFNQIRVMGLTDNPVISTYGGMQHNQTCSVLFQSMVPRPQRSAQFWWMAPPAGTGCIEIFATASLRSHTIFKDTLALQLCEESLSTSPFAVVHGDGVILKDDFDSSEMLDSTIWSDARGAEIGSYCGAVLHGNSLVFCEPVGKRELTSVFLNTTSAVALQFALSAGTCDPGFDDYSISISYAVYDRVDWHMIDKIRVPVWQNTTVHTVYIPEAARQEEVTFRFHQDLGPDAIIFQGCWALDNVLILNSAHRPQWLHESFDPFTPSNWLFFPNGVIKRDCESEENALFFKEDVETDAHRYVTSHDLDLLQEPSRDDIIFQEHFDHDIPSSWEVEGGEISSLCGTIKSRNSLVFNGAGKRIVCTPYIDARSVGNLRFHFAIGAGSCDPGDSSKFSVAVYAYVPGKKKLHLQTLASKSFKKPQLVSIPVPSYVRTQETQFCVAQHHHRGINRNVWAIDEFLLLPWIPSQIENVAQFYLDVGCASATSEGHVIFEFSTNHGSDWSLLHHKCHPGSCEGPVMVDDSIYTTREGWNLVTLPVPYAALTPRSRFRWKQLEGETPIKWGIDNVFLGSDCGPAHCSGHGFCTVSGCRCVNGFSGMDCEISDVTIASAFHENFETFNKSGSFSSKSGAGVSYECGVLISGEALVFNQNGPRELITQEFNTTLSGFLQFTIRIGSHSTTGSCPPPDSPSDGVLLLFSCNNGMQWSELKFMTGKEFLKPKTVLVTLPVEARKPYCRFRWWQPSQINQGRNVWALDDISLTSTPFYTFNIDFEDHESQVKQLKSSISFHLGEVRQTCGHSSALLFAGKSDSNEIRFIETQSMVVGGGKVIQFELNMGCGRSYGAVYRDDKKVFLEYSTDEGVTWSLLVPPCFPGESSCHGYHDSSAYDNSEFQNWRRVTVYIPDELRFEHVRFRWVQYRFSSTNEWTIDNIYIGEQCPEMCNGHGLCMQGQVCRCDPGYSGPSCTSDEQLPLSIQSDFEEESSLLSDWLFIHGGHISRSRHDCGTITSGGSLYFSGSGIRQLISKDVNTLGVTSIEFYIRMGGDDSYCQGFDSRAESILVQFSINGGVTWQLLQELYYDDYKIPRFVYLQLPDEARTMSTQFRWWQPSHSENDQWALDNILIGNGLGYRVHPNDILSDAPDEWLSTSNAQEEYYCNSKQPVLAFSGPAGNRFAVTNKKNVTAGDVVQFKIVVGCKSSFNRFNPVYLQYTQDGGQHWDFVVPPCYPSSDGTSNCPDGVDFQEGTMYHVGQFALWRLIVVPLLPHASGEQVQFRWWQEGNTHAPKFALSDVHIGSSCPESCNGNGICVRNQCHCDRGYVGPSCVSDRENPVGLQDKFEDGRRSISEWQQVVGATIGQVCGVVKMDNSLVFSARGPREARTPNLNTTSLKMLQFYIKIGSSEDNLCQAAVSQNESVLVQYSLNNGIRWITLKVIDPTLVGEKSIEVSLELPLEAKRSAVMFRWWQPFVGEGLPYAPWALDDVLIGANDTHFFGFDDTFDPISFSNWYSIMGSGTNSHCSSETYALTFDGDDRMPRYAETWDFHMTKASYIQFDLIMSCGSKTFSSRDLRLEYSLDMGRTWHLVRDECIPPEVGCHEYRYSSVLQAQLYNNWTRVLIPLPEGAVSDSTRFRWNQPSFKANSDTWAIDNVHIGSGCPWMCSGHGRCINDQCICDAGFEGLYCAPIRNVLSTQLLETFDEPWISPERWHLMLGGSLASVCGKVVAGKALVFNQPGIRILETVDLDTTYMSYIQFTLQFGCNGDLASSDLSIPLIIQYSYNGGITWGTIKELYPTPPYNKQFYSLELPSDARMDGTRFKFWQPQHSSRGDIWVLDNVFIGGNQLYRGQISADFDDHVSEFDWTFYPGGRFGLFCQEYGFSSNSSSSHLVFGTSSGDHFISTRDILVDSNTVIQFEINVGCSDIGSEQDPVRFEFSQDYGVTWIPVREDCFGFNRSRNNGCSGDLNPASVYYSGEGFSWQRHIIPLEGLHFCGTVRFRWYQGFYRSDQTPPEWALDNVYIGPSCDNHCSGHGICVKGMVCVCDEGFYGWYCEENEPLPSFLKATFEDGIDNGQFIQWSGAETTKKCGEVVEGKSLHFAGSGTRMLVTKDMDTSKASEIHFYIKLGCSQDLPSHKNHPVLFQYSTNGGVSWTFMEEIPFTGRYHEPTQIALEIPHGAQTNATRFRWWQPSREGVFIDEWAIDQIFIGGHFYGQLVLQDDFTSSIQSDGISAFTAHDRNWLIAPGSTMEPVCGSPNNALYFSNSGQLRYSISSDVQVTEESILQFDLVMGCESVRPQCFRINLDYSLDMGKHWQPVYESCLASDVDCKAYHMDSSFSADVYHQWQRVVIPLPAWTRSRATRFRWSQPPGFIPSNTWGLSYVYIGLKCTSLCSGHGRCDSGICICDAGWSGDYCSVPTLALPKAMRDTFSHEPFIGVGGWSGVLGASLTDSCGSVASGLALHFSKGCSRELVTWDLDTTKAEYVQFYFLYGCLDHPSQRNESVIIQFSTNGGIKWENLKELQFHRFSSPRFLSVSIPTRAKHNGTRFRWWQPLHTGQGLADWAIDNVFIGGTFTLPSELIDNFHSGTVGHHWLFTDNAVIDPYCDDTPGASSLVGGVDPTEDTAVTTQDLRLQPNAIMEFKISVTCNGSWSERKNPVSVSVSTNSGRTWDLLVTQCLPFDPQCQGQVRTSSVYYSNKGWNQVFIKIPSQFTERPVRFQWYQASGGQDGTSATWAIDNVYIGPACPDDCNGHGSCMYPTCHCFEGFTGETCQTSSGLQTSLKDTFTSDELEGSSWHLGYGSALSDSVPASCGGIRAGQNLYFGGDGQRLVETQDLDLRDARFVQFYIEIGGSENRRSCRTPTERDEMVIVQYSINGGISWTLLHVIDHKLYLSPTPVYLALPPSAKTDSTRIRWWQPVLSRKRVAQWVLDDVFIGGSEINVAKLEESFSGVDGGALDPSKWTFHPHGILSVGVCGNTDSVVYWLNVNNDPHDSAITTRQLIIAHDYIIQFKIVVGCNLFSYSPYTCPRNDPVLLQYSTQPHKSNWQLLHPPCLVSNEGWFCDPHYHQRGSEYDENISGNWIRVTLKIPQHAISSTTQFRWIQPNATSSSSPWSLDEVYIGPPCPGMCRGHGRCTTQGVCVCDEGFTGLDCSPLAVPISIFTENFEGGVLASQIWSDVRGGRIGQGCGGLVPHGLGKSLYFSGCGVREAVTAELDTRRAREISFVLQIGSVDNDNPLCHINMASGNLPNKGIILQFTRNNGIDWHLIKLHDPREFGRAQRVSYKLPQEAQDLGIRFRFWQPDHDGVNEDQWALDHIEVVTLRRHIVHHELERRKRNADSIDHMTQPIIMQL